MIYPMPVSEPASHNSGYHEWTALMNTSQSLEKAGGDEQSAFLAVDEEYLINPKVTTLKLECCLKEEGTTQGLTAVFVDFNEQSGAPIPVSMQHSMGSVSSMTDIPEKESSNQVGILKVNMKAIYANVSHIVLIAHDTNPLSVLEMHQMNGEVENLMCYYQFPKSISQSTVVGLFVRKNGFWRFKAQAIDTQTDTFSSLISNENVIQCLQKNTGRKAVCKDISISVYGGRNLEAKDIYSGRPDSADPYFIIFCGTEEKFRSSYERQTLNPTWSAGSEVKLGTFQETECKSMKIEILDHDAFSKDDFMGRIEIPIYAIYCLEDGEHKFYANLQPAAEYENETVSGMIYFTFAVQKVNFVNKQSSIQN